MRRIFVCHGYTTQVTLLSAIRIAARKRKEESGKGGLDMVEIPYISIAITLLLFVLLVIGYLWVDDVRIKRKRNKRIDCVRRKDKCGRYFLL